MQELQVGKSYRRHAPNFAASGTAGAPWVHVIGTAADRFGLRIYVVQDDEDRSQMLLLSDSDVYVQASEHETTAHRLWLEIKRLGFRTGCDQEPQDGAHWRGLTEDVRERIAILQDLAARADRFSDSSQAVAA